jgi:hypothetical protein
MKRFGIFMLVLIGFGGGIAFVYSCGGGSSGSTSNAQPLASEVLSFYGTLSSVGSSVEWFTVGASENFVITDIYSSYDIEISANGDVRFKMNNNTGLFLYRFASGIRFYPGETIKIKSAQAGLNPITISGHLN